MATVQSQELKHLQEQEDLKQLLKTPAGVRVLRRILKQTAVLSPSYSEKDPYATAHNEGLRRTGLWLLTEIERVDKSKLTTLLFEQEK
ncbi:hypothetical protein [Desulfovibrio litoralis]|uniref:Bbp19-like phage domain-containing protein n=1 Tax=Desulfovibrio litoralis DSM 11393 TaxID=1121455 RepID=A0A1M7T804_9BACT|nr:hypothetical protein [Desulfovibrio litoralis]SHN66826.1 hypothetical protein SAMN02745728_01697 [Desulfovibrio litoralis DSM 11393]